MITRESYGLQNRRNRKKNQLQSSQEMVNAVDKVSVSVRRAFNINRCQQDNLDNKVWTLERECRKSLGLLSFEQRKFIRSLKPSMTRRRTDGKTSNVLKHSNTTVGKLAGRSGLNSSKHLPALVDGRKLQSNDPTVRRHYFSYQDCFKDSKDRQTLSKQESAAEKVHLPFITEPNKSGRHKRKKTVGRKDKHAPLCNVDKENDENPCRINVKDMKKLPSLSTSEVSKDSLVCDGGTNKMQTRLISKNHLNPRALHIVTESRKEHSLPSRKIGLNCETHLNNYNYVDKNTEVRVKEFLKLPPIGGIRESPMKEQNESGEDVEQLQEEWIKKFGGVNAYQSRQSVDIKDKASWKNLVHCRYLRIGDRHQTGKEPKTCQCNWCAMVKKNMSLD